MKSFFKVVWGSFYLLAAAAALGITVNAVRPDGISLIRKPLRETRRTVNVAEIVPSFQDSQPQEVHISPTEIKPETEPKKLEFEEKTESKEPKPTPQTQSKQQTLPATAPPTPMKPEAKPIKPLTSAKPKQQTAPVKKEALFTNLADAKKLFDSKSAIFVDARPPEDYEAEHIVGALSLYNERLNELYDSVLGNVPKDKIIITYCSDPECLSALKLADALLAKGHKNVFIMLEGIPGWKEAGYPTAGKAHGG